MLHLFLNPSPLLVGGEVLVGMSIPIFVAALIVAFGDRIKLSGRWGLGRLARGRQPGPHGASGTGVRQTRKGVLGRSLRRQSAL
jgi:hypothetical protein